MIPWKSHLDKTLSLNQAPVGHLDSKHYAGIVHRNLAEWYFGAGPHTENVSLSGSWLWDDDNPKLAYELFRGGRKVMGLLYKRKKDPSVKRLFSLLTQTQSVRYQLPSRALVARAHILDFGWLFILFIIFVYTRSSEHVLFSYIDCYHCIYTELLFIDQTIRPIPFITLLEIPSFVHPSAITITITVTLHFD